jgi:hypothetical protein
MPSDSSKLRVSGLVWSYDEECLHRIAPMRESGGPTGKTCRLEPGEDERRVAGRLALQAWHGRAGESDFNRPLNYGRFGVA